MCILDVLSSYGIFLLQLVIGNLLHSRKHHVVMVEPDTHYDITLNEAEMAEGVEIEQKIVADLVMRHNSFLIKGV